MFESNSQDFPCSCDDLLVMLGNCLDYGPLEFDSLFSKYMSKYFSYHLFYH